MKKNLCLILCVSVLAGSCKKNSSGPSSPPIDATQYYVSSVRSYTPGALGLDSFTYNAAHLLTKYVEYGFDSTSGSPQSDSLVFEFAYTGNSPVPASYTFSQPDQGTVDELHNLSYDAQNRVTKDVCPSRSDFFTDYSYPNSNLAATLQFSSAGLDNQIDTMFLTNGNMTKQVVYFPNDAGTADSLNGTIQISYSSFGNPMYHPAISGTIGHLLFVLSFDGFQNFVDFNSKNLDNSITDIEAGSPPVTYKYNIAADSKGRASTMTYASLPNTYRIVYSYY
jgi:hypothetical protein